MKYYKDIAIIGMSSLLPEAETIDEFECNLRKGMDCIKEIPKRRLELSGMDANKEYIKYAYLDEIENFDHSFFDISLREAICMDPQQRIILQLACAAIENAGYSLSSFSESNTAVVIGAGNKDYKDLLKETNGTAFIGNILAVLAGKIAYHLNLTGPAMIVDTSCSSSLVAVHEACTKLITGQADKALAGGVNINVFYPGIEYLETDHLGIASPDGKSKTFDSKANGAGGGEGAGIVLLKRLDDAIKDKDNIYAVIKGSAINQDGGRSNSIASPSPKAQTEVIIEAWRQADINPETITYIESHGTGTKIGDPIEVQALTDAFNEYTDKKSFCALGSVKTNIGHLANAAGITSLIKTVLTINNKTIYPLVHYKEPNPLIDFENSAIFPQKNIKEWKCDGKRRAGVSSFGLSGTNAHVVLEEYISEEKHNKNSSEKEYLITLSAKTEKALKDYEEKLIKSINRNNYNVKDISYVLNKGRDDYKYRKSDVVSNIDDLLKFLNSDCENIFRNTENDEKLLVFLCSGDMNVEQQEIDNMLEKYSVFNLNWEKYKVMFDLNNPNIRRIIFQISIYQTWISMGIKPKHIFGSGIGNLTAQIITGKLTVKDAIDKIKSMDGDYSFDKNSFQKVIEKLMEGNKPIFVELGSNGMLMDALNEIALTKNIGVMPSIDSDRSILRTLSKLYLENIPIAWEKYYENKSGKKIGLPTYPFEKKCCWPKVEPIKVNVDKIARKEDINDFVDIEGTEIEKQLAQIWSGVLDNSEFGLEDDFFDLGGNSIMGMQIINRIKERLGVEIDFEDMYDYSTISELAEYIASFGETQKEIAVADNTDKLCKIPRTEFMDISYSQERMLYIYYQEPEASFYNMPASILLTGNLEIKALKEAINELVRRHEILRTIYGLKDNTPYQQILEYKELNIEVLDLTEFNEEAKEIKIKEISDREMLRPFNLTKDISFRAKILKLNDKEHILLVQMHHIAADGWSIGIFLNEISKVYNALASKTKPELCKIPLQYADYASWQRKQIEGEIGKKQLEYWLKRLENASKYLAFPTDFSRPEESSYKGKTLKFDIGSDLVNKIKTYCKQEQVTLFMFLIAAYNILLYRYSNQEDICVGIPIANRQSSELENLMGYFANTLVIRTTIDGDETIEKYLKAVKKLAIEAFQNQDIPFETVVQNIGSSRDTSYSPVFQYAFALQNAPRKTLDLKNLEVEFLDTQYQSSKFDMSLSIYEEDSILKGMFEYSTELFRHETIEKLAKHYKNLLRSIISKPENTLNKLSMLSEDEIKAVINESVQDNENYDF
ncbi:condensation domain-containing protein [Wukongibacter sp. M2B1]|uniref:condensation domain-containing protein n=1 Tax=Wukongibacter sp. M2B1 TaxID=3088895 RepID=UPI003D7B87C2